MGDKSEPGDARGWAGPHLVGDLREAWPNRKRDHQSATYWCRRCDRCGTERFLAHCLLRVLLIKRTKAYKANLVLFIRCPREILALNLSALEVYLENAFLLSSYVAVHERGHGVSVDGLQRPVGTGAVGFGPACADALIR